MGNGWKGQQKYTPRYEGELVVIYIHNNLKKKTYLEVRYFQVKKKESVSI